MAEFVVGVALAIPALVELSIKLGKDLVDKFQSFRNYGHEVDELVLVIENHWFRLEKEMNFLASIENDLESNLKDHFKKLSNILCSKFRDLRLKIDEYARKEKIMFRLKFVFFKKLLAEAISVFNSRHHNLMDLFCTLTLNPSEVIDQKIRSQPTSSTTQSISMVRDLRDAIMAMKTKRIKGREVNFNIDDSYRYNRQAIRHTTAKIQQTPGSTRQLLIDSIPCSPSERAQRIQDVRQLALVLKSVTPSNFGILPCAGIVEATGTQEASTIEMVFDVPPGLGEPQSLRSLLLNHQNGAQYPIDARIDLAKQLARTVLYVHAVDFVHKNFRPETIIIFNSHDTIISSTIGFPFLIGFQKSRPVAGGVTLYLGDTAWEQNIYRHPERQGQFHQTAYQMEHDIYSLGVCLLEIALWKSLVIWDEYEQPMKSDLSQFLLGPTESGGDVKADEIKARLVKIAKENIPQILGSRYAEVTVLCLTCLDCKFDDDADTMVEEEDEVSGKLLNPLREMDTTVTVGASYIEKILGKLEEISV